MVKVIDKSKRRKAQKVYITLKDSRSPKTRGLTLEGVTLSQAFKAIAGLDASHVSTSGTESIGVQGRTTESHN